MMWSGVVALALGCSLLLESIPGSVGELPPPIVFGHLGGAGTPIKPVPLPEQPLQIVATLVVPCIGNYVTSSMVKPLLLYPKIHDASVTILDGTLSNIKGIANLTQEESLMYSSIYTSIKASLNNLEKSRILILDKLQKVTKASFSLDGIMSVNPQCDSPQVLFDKWEMQHFSASQVNLSAINNASKPVLTNRVKRHSYGTHNFYNNRFETNHHFNPKHSCNSLQLNESIDNTNDQSINSDVKNDLTDNGNDNPEKTTTSPVKEDVLNDGDRIKTKPEVMLTDLSKLIRNNNQVNDDPIRDSINQAWHIYYDMYQEVIRQTPDTRWINTLMCPQGAKKIGQCVSKVLQVIQSKPVISRVKPSPMQTSNIRRRSKRAVLRFMGDLYKWLFGVATEEDMEKITGVLQQLNDRMDSQSEFMVKTKDELTIMIKTSVEALEARMEELKNALNILTDKLSVVSMALSKVSGTVTNLKALIVLSSTALQAMTLVDQEITIFNVVETILNNVDDLLKSMVNMIRTQSVDPRIVSISDIAQSATNLLRTVSEDYRISRLVDYQYLIYSNNVKVRAEGGIVHISVRVPLERKGDDITFWRLTFMPMVLYGGRGVVTPLSPIIAINLGRQQYRFITEQEYQNCLQIFIGTCRIAHPWYEFSLDQCIVPSLMGKPTEISKCPMQILSDLDDDTFSIVELRQCIWGIQPNRKEHKLSRYCNDNINIALSDEYIVKTMSLLELKPGCHATYRGVKLECPLVVTKIPKHMTTTLSASLDIEKSTGAIMLPEIQQIHMAYDIKDWEQSMDGIIGNVKDGLAKVSWKSPSAAMKLKDLMQSSSKETTKYIISDSAKSALINKAISDLPKAGVNWWQWIMLGLVIYCTIVCTYLIIRTCVSGKSRGSFFDNAAMALSPLSIPGSYANSTNSAKNTSAVYNTSTNPTTLVNNSIVTPNITSPGVNLIVQLPTVQNSTIIHATWDLVHSPWFMIGIMLLLHMLCMVVMLRRMSRMHRHLKTLCGHVPLNTTTTHHINENALIMSIIVMCKSLFRSKVSRHEIKLQVATLPRSNEEWYLTIDNTKPDFLKKSRTNRWNFNLDFKVQWGYLCILSYTNPSIETCASLPETISVPLSDIIPQMLGNELTLWTYLTVESVNRITLQTGFNSRDLYIATIPTITVITKNPRNDEMVERVTPNLLDSPIHKFAGISFAKDINRASSSGDTSSPKITVNRPYTGEKSMVLYKP